MMKANFRYCCLLIMFFVLVVSSTIYADGSLDSTSVNSGLYVSKERETEIKKEIITFIESFEESFNKGDLEAMKDSLHFPNYRLRNMTFQSIEKFDPKATQRMFDYLRSTDWHWTDFDDYRFIHVNDDKVHLDIAFTRYKRNGDEIDRWRSIYILTKEGERWGIKFRSSWAHLGR